MICWPPENFGIEGLMFTGISFAYFGGKEKSKIENGKLKRGRPLCP
jgi:hypothetical protein